MTPIEDELFGIPMRFFPKAREALAHATRYAIVEAAASRPGISVPQLRATLGLPRRTFDHHLDVVLETDLVVRHYLRLGRRWVPCLFQPHGYRGIEDYAMPHFRDGPGGRMLRHVAAHALLVTTYARMARDLGMGRKQVVDVLESLRRYRLVQMDWDGRLKLIWLDKVLRLRLPMLDAKLKREGFAPLRLVSAPRPTAPPTAPA